ncbi:MAG: anti-sigma factor [Candidatus Aminicenantes bacterium]|nr:anti-sigma factor [Candidatus Aminicenantes bacterium]
MKCKKVHSRLSAYQDGELPVAEAGELERHLGVCAACQSEWRDTQALVAGLRRLTTPAPFPGFSSRVMAFLRDRPEKKRRWLPSLAYTLALLLIFISGFLLEVSSNGQYQTGTATGQRQNGTAPKTAATFSAVLAENQGLGLLAVQDSTLELCSGGAYEN